MYHWKNLEGWNFSQSLREFAAFLSSRQTRVLLTTTFWPNTAVNDQLLHAAAEMNWQVVQLSQLGAQDSYMALEEYSNESVARHPNDQGMQAISSLIAGKILGRMIPAWSSKENSIDQKKLVRRGAL